MTRLLTMLLVLALTVPLAAQWTYTKPSAEVTVSSAAIALFSSDDVNGAGHPTAQQAVCSLTGANIRVSWGTTPPTTSLGAILTPGQYTVTGADVMLSAKGIRDDSTDATWNCVLYGR